MLWCRRNDDVQSPQRSSLYFPYVLYLRCLLQKSPVCNIIHVSFDENLFWGIFLTESEEAFGPDLIWFLLSIETLFCRLLINSFIVYFALLHKAKYNTIGIHRGFFTMLISGCKCLFRLIKGSELKYLKIKREKSLEHLLYLRYFEKRSVGKLLELDSRKTAEINVHFNANKILWHLHFKGT